MGNTRGSFRWVGNLVAVALALGGSVAAVAQAGADEFLTGSASAAWDKWQPAMQAILDRNADQAEKLFGELLQTNPSPLRIALLADRTVNRTALGGALLLLEQDHENKALRADSEKVAVLLEQGREQMNEADDAWYFCAIGRFDVAEANFRALLASNPDPVALLEFTEQKAKRRDVLVQLTDNVTVGDSIRAVLALLDRGEEKVKADPTRIKANIDRLGGTPRAYENGCSWLCQSGEYAIPFLVQALRDPAQKPLLLPIERCLPQIDRAAMNPLVIAIRMTDDTVTQRYLIDALGKIGYGQALPYLLQVREREGTPADVVAAANQAIQAITGRHPELGSESASESFYRLADEYFRDQASLAADPRLETANVWYWRENLLQNTEVPTQVFNEIMAMRCCEEALRLMPDLPKAEALWLAANFRRDAQVPAGQSDATRPENYPSPAYFAQTAGPSVCLLTLARAVDDGDPVVALGAIEALHGTAGPASVIADSAGRLPLAEALSFPDRMVRIRAALTLGAARPTQEFANYQNLMPVLSEALMLFAGARNALAVDPDTDTANRVAGVLRADGYEVASDSEFLRGLQKVRESFPSVDVIFLGSNLTDLPLADALKQLRSEFRFSATPVIVVTRPGDHETVANLARADHRIGEISPGADDDKIKGVMASIGHAAGVTPITPELGTALALEAAEVLRMLAVTNNPLFHVSDAQSSLILAIGGSDTALKLSAAKVLGYIADPQAQEAIAKIALDTAQPEEMRVNMLAALAEAAKHTGNHLGSESVDRIVALAQHEENLVLRTAASQTLGALNLVTNKGSEIIREQYRG